MEHPPVSTPLQVHDELALTINQSGDVPLSGMVHGVFSSKEDFSPISLTSLSITPSPLGNLNASFQSYTFVPEFNHIQMDSGMKLSGLHDQHIATNSINVSSVAPSFFNPPTMIDPMRNAGGVHHPTNDFNMLSVDSLTNQGVFCGGFQHPEVDMNFLQRRSNVVMEDTESNSSNIFKTAVCQNTGNSMPLLEHTQNIRGTEMKNAFQANDSQYCTPKEFDGSFLTLGVGGNREQRSRNSVRSTWDSKYSIKEIASKLDGPVSPHVNSSPSPQIRRNFTISPHSFTGGSDAYDTSTGCNFGHHIVSASNDTVMMSASSRPDPNPFPFPLTAQSANQPRSSVNYGRNSDFVVKTNSMYMPMDRAEGVLGDQVLSSLTFTNTSSSHLGYTKQSDIASESFNPAFFRPKTMSEQLQSYSNSVMNMPPESSMYSCLPRARGGLVRPNHFGHQSSSGQATSLNNSGNGIFPQRNGVHIAENSVMQPPFGNQFPKRLGLQLNSDATSQVGQERVFYKEAAHLPQAGKLLPAQNRGPAQLPMVSAKGPTHGSIPIQMNKSISGPDFVTGHGIPTANANAIPQASNIHGQPSVKRKANEPPPVSQRRKLSHCSMAHPRQILQPPLHTSSPTLPLPHLKWQGSDGSPKPTGNKCLLCKRDVAFSPDGSTHQPSNPPAVAVLPCGHVFHDHCLHIITPEDQLNDPPCIPCAIGES